ncbi:MAG TPA: methyltransferase [Bacillales bacterium]|nr:methyltransferase [Bacillales bacterium]
MTDHYFTRQPNAESQPKSWEAELKGNHFRFTSDEGVFAKRGIDPGTKWLIDAFQMPWAEGALLDVGCGYGPIGLALAKNHPERKVVMVDINERAVALAAANAEANDVHNVSVLQSDLFERVDTKYAAILSNPPIRTGKKVIYKLFEQAGEHLVENGEFWTVIRKQQGAASAFKKLQTLFSEVTTVFKKKGYIVMKAVK